ncbi:proline--tRNA ligase [Candidatus Saccharibacteria bacterium]|nr:proline--tRNA ligase [Candidatus Saccharibacteria bacterium]
MKMSRLFTKTRKQAPADEVARNAQLLIKAGYIHKEMAGVYAYLPLGLKVIENIKAIVREEMNATGGQELIMTSLQRKELWETTDRWDDEKVDVWFKSSLKNGTEVGFGWSHEEQITEMMKNYITSYRDLPANVYQFQTKLRNELRAKSGIMRGREFVMKDAYTYSRSDEEHQKIYDAITEAYLRVFERVGLGDVTFVTFASGGAFTQYSHEFQTLSEAGEDIVFRVPSTGETFNEEIAPAKAAAVKADKELLPMQSIEGKGVIGVEALAKQMGIAPEKTTKTMLYQAADGAVIAVVIRGGRKINEEKLAAIAGSSVKLADEATVKRVTGAEIGYAGLLNLPSDVRIIVDDSCAGLTNFEMGANKTNYHNCNVNWGRDLPEPEQFYDIKIAVSGDLHPETGEVYEVHKAAEVGNIFSFGTTKSEQLGLYFSDEDGTERPVVLGSYGIGITRLMGVLVEHFADERGIVWPENVAPYQVVLVRLGASDEVTAEADALYEKLQSSGVTVLYDDRDARAGEKFADADLIGIPHRVVISEKLVAAGKVEYKHRTKAEPELLTTKELEKRLRSPMKH